MSSYYRKALQDFNRGGGAPIMKQWTVVYPNDVNSLVVEHVTAASPKAAIAAAGVPKSTDVAVFEGKLWAVSRHTAR